jgi:hypothetical protein
MECDSMHPAFEFAKKKTEIYIPSQWASIIRMARRNNPYYVVPLQYEDIYDFKEVTKSTVKYRKVDSEGIKVRRPIDWGCKSQSFSLRIQRLDACCRIPSACGHSQNICDL